MVLMDNSSLISDGPRCRNTSAARITETLKAGKAEFLQSEDDLASGKHTQMLHGIFIPAIWVIFGFLG